MRVLLSTIGSRGDVQPLVALGLALRALGHDVRLCVPPDFRAWAEGLGLPVTPIGPELRATGKASPGAAPPTPEQRLRLIEGTVLAQFETIAAAAQGCELIVGATALQLSLRATGGKVEVASFHPAFIIIGLISAASTFFFLRLPKNAGEEMSGRRMQVKPLAPDPVTAMRERA